MKSSPIQVARGGVGVMPGVRHRRSGGMLILAVAALLMAPELFSGPAMSDSFGFTIVWVEQFAALMRDGTIYPRWLPGSWDGMGSPTFYFYPPLYFLLAGILSVMTGGLLSVAVLVPLTNYVVLAASGLAMQRWLACRADAGTALIGAIVYMAAPYHIYAVYGRGAVAEACAYAALPVIAIALERAAIGRRHGVVAVAGAFALLILAHLPAALLASLTLLPAWALYLAWRTPAPGAAIGRMVVGGLIGGGLAAAYLLPALGFLGQVTPDALGGDFYSPQKWFFANWADWPGKARAFLVALMTMTTLLLGVAVLAGAHDKPLPEARFWGGLSIVAALLVTGAIPWFWQLPYVAKVQFPFRLLPVAEFAAITGLALCRFRLPRSSVMMIALPLAVLMAMNMLIMVDRTAETRRIGADRMAEAREGYRDAPEYLPAGTSLPAAPGPLLTPGSIRLPVMALAASPDPDVRVVATDDGKTGLQVSVSASRPSLIVARRHWFPGWVVERDGTAVPTGPDDRGLLTWRAPTGSSRFTVSRAAPDLARWASAISFLTFLLWLLLLVRPYWPKGAASPSIAGNDDSQ